MRVWHWPQGRIKYLGYDNLKKMAQVLVPLDGVAKATTRQNDPLLPPLTYATGLEFKPDRNDYPAWRNYDKVFECSLLATIQNNQFLVTEVCRRLAMTDTDPLDVDEYLTFLIPRFTASFPAFSDYDATASKEYPFCAVLKYLLTSFQKGNSNGLRIQDVIELLLGNPCDGTEDLDFYARLRPVPFTPTEEAERQMRESLLFISQSSFLKWHRRRLYLDIMAGDDASEAAFRSMMEPANILALPDPAAQILALGTGLSNAGAPLLTARQLPSNIQFTEGKRVRATHLRIERSGYLRQTYFAQQRKPYLCDMCRADLKNRYSWTDNLLEIHHLLPLSSSLITTKSGTSLEDVVALCPNCHKSVHVYYKWWLNSQYKEDFRDEQEARTVYQQVRGRITL